MNVISQNHSVWRGASSVLNFSTNITGKIQSQLISNQKKNPARNRVGKLTVSFLFTSLFSEKHKAPLLLRECAFLRAMSVYHRAHRANNQRQ